MRLLKIFHVYSCNANIIQKTICFNDILCIFTYYLYILCSIHIFTTKNKLQLRRWEPSFLIFFHRFNSTFHHHFFQAFRIINKFLSSSTKKFSNFYDGIFPVCNHIFISSISWKYFQHKILTKHTLKIGRLDYECEAANFLSVKNNLQIQADQREKVQKMCRNHHSSNCISKSRKIQKVILQIELCEP